MRLKLTSRGTGSNRLMADSARFGYVGTYLEKRKRNRPSVPRVRDRSPQKLHRNEAKPVHESRRELTGCGAGSGREMALDEGALAGSCVERTA